MDRKRVWRDEAPGDLRDTTVTGEGRMGLALVLLLDFRVLA